MNPAAPSDGRADRRRAFWVVPVVVAMAAMAVLMAGWILMVSPRPSGLWTKQATVAFHLHRPPP